MTDEPAAEVRALLADLEEQGTLPAHALSVDEARNALEDLFARPDGPPVGDVRDLEIPGPEAGVPVRIYTPDEPAPYPVLVYFHGGGWVRGNLDTHDGICRWLAADAGCLVISVAYRRAPENRFPAAVEDAYAAVEWAANNGSAFRGEPDRLAVAGDSAGGNLAAAVSLMARDRNGPAIEHQLLLYPVLDHAFDTASYEENAEGYLLTRASMRFYWSQYLRRELDGQHPYASPLQARSVDRLPGAGIVTCGFDPLRDEGIAYADRLRDSGVPVTHDNYEEMIHGFLSFPDLDGTRKARSAIAGNLREALEP